jgi:hypothetical protein
MLNSYRGVSVIHNILKIFEKLLLNNLLSFLNKEKIIPSNQYGFTKNSGTEKQLIDFIHTVTSLDAVFIDKSNALIQYLTQNFCKNSEKLVLEDNFS